MMKSIVKNIMNKVNWWYFNSLLMFVALAAYFIHDTILFNVVFDAVFIMCSIIFGALCFIIGYLHGYI